METPIPAPSESSPAAKTAVAGAPLVGSPEPPPSLIAKIWKHLQNWQEIYLFFPLSLLSIWAFAQFGYFLTGRRPTENVDYIVGMAGNLVKCVCLIVLLSVKRQQTGVWLTKAEQIAHPDLARSQMIESCVIAIVFAWVLSH